ncbi:MAG: bacillithiol biosynthesis cysteine-adding enzyme BshC [Gemmatimonadota bacterium]|nr:bacillithiol biosynthesis cysteine-adding enzyme BshC [Gemmatimonadota bacterium]
MAEPRILTNSPGGSSLSRAAAAGSLPNEWYAKRPASAAEWRARAESIRAEPGARDWLAALAPAFDAQSTAAQRLAAVAEGRGVVVTTGQQPGLFGGPIYTWSKALGALTLADALQQATGIPTAPVFWAATDDSDFAEASITYVAVPGGVETLRTPPPAVAERRMRDTPLGDVGALLEVLARGAGSASYPDAIEAARECYGAKETVGSAYVALLRRLLEPLGIAVLDAGHPAVRHAARPTLRAALERAADIERALLARDAELTAAGHAPQVATMQGLTLVFDSSRGDRRRIAANEIAEVLRRGQGDDLGPNVLLRPIVERAILPTVSYLAGPGEFAYFAQVSAVASAMGASAPVAVPRWSGTIVEPHVDRILDRYYLTIDELRDAHAAETRIARERMPGEVREALARFSEHVAEAHAKLARVLESAAIVRPEVVSGSARALANRAGRLERRVLAAVKQRETAMRVDLATARGALFPLGIPQERALNFLPLLARHGPRLIERMAEAAREHARALTGA